MPSTIYSLLNHTDQERKSYSYVLFWIQQHFLKLYKSFSWKTELDAVRSRVDHFHKDWLTVGAWIMGQAWFINGYLFEEEQQGSGCANRPRLHRSGAEDCPPGRLHSAAQRPQQQQTDQRNEWTSCQQLRQPVDRTKWSWCIKHSWTFRNDLRRTASSLERLNHIREWLISQGAVKSDPNRAIVWKMSTITARILSRQIKTRGEYTASHQKEIALAWTNWFGFFLRDLKIPL